jgi:hypothetical protein
MQGLVTDEGVDGARRRAIALQNVQSLCNRCAIAVQLIRKREIAMKSIRDGCAIIVQSIRNVFVNGAQSICNRFVNVAQSIRNPCAIIVQSQRNRFAYAA